MATMNMPALEGALEKIQDFREINFIRTATNDSKKRFLIAGKVGGESIQLTKPESVLTYPFEPTKSFSSHLGDLYCKNFVYFQDDFMFNWKNIEGLDITKGEKEGKLSVVASFLDGTKENLYSFNEKEIIAQEYKIITLMNKVNDKKENAGLLSQNEAEVSQM